MSLEVSHRGIPSTFASTSRDAGVYPSAGFNTARPIDAFYMQEAPTYDFLSKKRKPSKPRTARALSKPPSTTHLRESNMSDADLDKKRNKLGYQRISIACAHCRRRKIRCLLAEDDSHSRCQNCIRLKKECVFYPVDQQSAIENKSQSSPAKTGPSSAVSSSPSDIGYGKPFEERREPSNFPKLPSNAPTPYQGVPLEPATTLADQGSLSQFEYGYQQPAEIQPPWTTPESYPAPLPTDHPSPGYWHYNQTESPGDFAPYPIDPMQPQAHPQSAPPIAFPHDRPVQMETYQHHPVRSTSHGHMNQFGQQNIPYSGFHAGPPQHYPPPRHAPPALDMHNPAMMGPSQGPHSAPVGQQHYGFVEHQHPHPYALHHHEPQYLSGTVMSPHPAYSGGWYQDPNSFGPPQENHPGMAADWNKFGLQHHPPG